MAPWWPATAASSLTAGSYADESPEVSPVAAFFSQGPYRIPNMRVEAWSVYTNLSRASAFRGFGNPQATFASESQLDDLADQLGMDPPGTASQQRAGAGRQIFLRQNHREGHDAGLPGKSAGCLRAGPLNGQAADRPRPEKKRGIGMAGMSHISGLAGAGANVLLNEDGSVTLNCGAVDIGQGSDTIFTQIVAGALALDMDQVNFAAPDTDSIAIPVPDLGKPQHLYHRARGEKSQRRRPGSDLSSCRGDTGVRHTMILS